MSPDGRSKPLIAVCGAGTCQADLERLARDTGRELARSGAVLICGGLGGVMEAAARGAREAGGLTVGFLPGFDPRDANPFIDVPLATGLGHVRNALIARAARALIALPGGPGTLSEIALGLKMGKRVIGLTAWGDVDGVQTAPDPKAAVQMALAG